ncbi:hypothetical protein [Paludisphaera mucosa]|uniref:Uncharacterized protein n=1 Tax=Paludisphaera mucosa TaxID=3030827 RepID=A0ABT6FK45_9BACT|nr:hypothetical protein [Paludisphaera mucosa]MDG3007924.1 hypothetical protein [Paludisphaera mucosa]
MTTTPNEGAPPRSWKPEDPESTPRPRLDRAVGRGEVRYSGRRFVIGGLITITLFWIGLFAILRPGLVGYKQRSEFGRREVAPAVFGMLKVQPPGVDPRAWDDAVRAAHGLLATATDSGSMSIETLTALRDKVQAAAARAQARPEAALAELAALWDDVAADAQKFRRPGEPDLDRRHARPSILPPAKG